MIVEGGVWPEFLFKEMNSCQLGVDFDEKTTSNPPPARPFLDLVRLLLPRKRRVLGRRNVLLKGCTFLGRTGGGLRLRASRLGGLQCLRIGICACCAVYRSSSYIPSIRQSFARKSDGQSFARTGMKCRVREVQCVWGQPSALHTTPSFCLWEAQAAGRGEELFSLTFALHFCFVPDATGCAHASHSGGGGGGCCGLHLGRRWAVKNSIFRNHQKRSKLGCRHWVMGLWGRGIRKP